MILSLDESSKEYAMTVFDNFEMTFSVGQLKICNLIYDTAGQGAYTDVRQVAVTKSDVVFIVCEMSDVRTLNEAKNLFVQMIQVFKDNERTRRMKGNQLCSTVNGSSEQSQALSKSANSAGSRAQESNRSARSGGTLRKNKSLKGSSSKAVEYHADLPKIVLVCNKLDLYDESSPSGLTKKNILEVKKDMENMIKSCGLNPFESTIPVYYTSARETPRRTRCIFILEVTNFIRACNGQKPMNMKILSSLHLGGEEGL
ncbi:MAG: hypothetical protein MHMPM18_004132 [Marteilia pararefringens]